MITRIARIALIAIAISTPSGARMPRRVSLQSRILLIGLLLSVVALLSGQFVYNGSGVSANPILQVTTQADTLDGVCDLEPCSRADLIQRDDDKKETIRKRLDVYHEITEPIISFYVAKGVLKPIACSDKSPDAIAERIEQLVTEICNGQDEVRA